MRSRDLPCCRTLRFAHPPSTRWSDQGNFVIFASPEHSDTLFGNRLELDTRPARADLPGWFARWTQFHDPAKIHRAYLCWEEPTHGPQGSAHPPDVPPDVRVDPLSILQYAQPVSPRAPRLMK